MFSKRNERVARWNDQAKLEQPMQYQPQKRLRVSSVELFEKMGIMGGTA